VKKKSEKSFQTKREEEMQKTKRDVHEVIWKIMEERKLSTTTRKTLYDIKLKFRPGQLIELLEPRYLPMWDSQLFEGPPALSPEEEADVADGDSRFYEKKEGMSLKPGCILLYLGWQRNRYADCDEAIWLVGEQKVFGWIDPADFKVVKRIPVI
jgi:hypothetical protein